MRKTYEVTIFWGIAIQLPAILLGTDWVPGFLTLCPISKVRDLCGPLCDYATSTFPPGTDHGNAIAAVGLLGGLCSDGGLGTS